MKQEIGCAQLLSSGTGTGCHTPADAGIVCSLDIGPLMDEGAAARHRLAGHHIKAILFVLMVPRLFIDFALMRVPSC
ncbi:hypothetical protein [Paraburkholderia silvatlantica]|uniref:Uncharacterized protein n=1 Tax=Paraburkholderia silvatlantica TaxID=321895 RepID=A0ABR6FL02_9BURK|nr:hypothetical protein [Paraburkholderia silvatlantica]MBB2928116.1 hypothetical protein [Paraburkholderia silvatlantica]